MEDDFQWKTTFNRRQPSMEGNFQWKTTFNKRQPSIVDMMWEIEDNPEGISSVALLSPACYCNLLVLTQTETRSLIPGMILVKALRFWFRSYPRGGGGGFQLIMWSLPTWVRLSWAVSILHSLFTTRKTFNNSSCTQTFEGIYAQLFWLSADGRGSP